MKEVKQQIVMMPIDDIIPYENNPRHNDNAVEPTANSIDQLGFRGAIIVDKNNVIIAGHTRLKAAQKLGMTEIPVIVADDMTEEEAAAYRLADNKTAELAGWDFTALAEEIDNIGDTFDMTDFGFRPEDLGADGFDIDSLFEDAGEQPEKGPKTVTCPNCGTEVPV